MYAFGWNERTSGTRPPLACARFEHATLDVALEVQQAHQRVRFGDAEVVAGEDPQASAPVEQVAKVLEHAIDAALSAKLTTMSARSAMAR